MILFSYINGNVKVEIHDDGSKIRTYDGIANPVHPESIDVKITNYCDGGCEYCHEKSTKLGAHGNLKQLAEVLSELPSGVEIAIGGGNPVSHPDLKEFLTTLKRQGIIANITVNQKHIKSSTDILLNLINEKLIYGLGISYNSIDNINDIVPLLEATNNIVFHVIMGVNEVSDVDVLKEFCDKYNKTCNILVLGYKEYGFGKKYYLRKSHIETNKYEWYTNLALHFKQPGLVLSFDNLAISQLNIRRYFTDAAWNEFYMGDDFVFTMYIDGVEGKYAASSTSSERVNFEDSSLLEYFQKNRRQ